jgi:hypothetical protein
MRLQQWRLLRHLRDVAVHDGLFERSLRAHLRGHRVVHERLFQWRLRHLLRVGTVQRRLLERSLQHLLPAGSDVHGRLLVRGLFDGLRVRIHMLGRMLVGSLQPGVRHGRHVHVHELLERPLLVYRRGLHEVN